jgi:hypothetical protein
MRLEKVAGGGETRGPVRRRREPEVEEDASGAEGIRREGGGG